ncbi:hypothetical protein BDY19DRAFT_906975 [Irpex rosettiformis]|uniref:Uncharacterized protein n=1 Tax=Irpex rosettiformis TaxID=378272 RepID=A0ACB8U179_9APHY|nr:hypothetical protein BDY19DRAFT_906975 [Irpex rosettiformis]
MMESNHKAERKGWEEKELKAQRNGGREEGVPDDEETVISFDCQRVDKWRTVSRSSAGDETHTPTVRDQAPKNATVHTTSPRAILNKQLQTLSPGELTLLSTLINSLVNPKPSSGDTVTLRERRAGSPTGTGKGIPGASGLEHALIPKNMGGDPFAGKKAPEPLLALLAHRHHLPLTMCTDAALKEIRSGYGIKYAKVYNFKAEKAYLIDTSQWPEETSINVEDWHQAYRNFLVILEDTGNDSITTLFRAHYDHLCTREGLSTFFESVLEFDIESRVRELPANH